jgi:peptide/nickel transport system substrate-binding protein
LGRWSNAETDRLIARIKVETDPAKRNDEIRRALLVANRELPIVTLHQPLIPWAMRRNVSTWFSPVNTVYFYRTRID